MRTGHLYRRAVRSTASLRLRDFGGAGLLCLGLLGALPAAGQVVVTPDDYDESAYEDPYTGGYENREPLAAPVVRDFDRERWVALTKDLSYEEAALDTTETEDGQAADRSEKVRSEKSSRYRPPARPNRELGSIGLLLKIFGLLLGLVALVFLLLQVFGGGTALFRRNRKVRGDALAIDLENIEANLEQTALETFIQRAVREERYRLAVRLYYLDILKALSARGVVRWKRDKTNGEYLRALRGHPLEADFAAATRTFERVWYGRAELSAAAFTRIEPGLQALTRAAEAAMPAL